MYFMWVPYDGAIAPPTTDETPLVVPVSGCATVLRETLQDLPLAALASAWSITDRELMHGPSRERLGALITLRALILDEVEQRFPRRYRAWLRWGGPHAIRSYHHLIVLV